MPIICKESCRLSSPEDLVGDYVRGRSDYDNPRLIIYYPGLFEVVPMQEEVETEMGILPTETSEITSTPTKKNKSFSKKE